MEDAPKSLKINNLEQLPVLTPDAGPGKLLGQLPACLVLLQ